MTKHTFTLTVGEDIDITIHAEDSGKTWNGYAVPVLTTEQAAIISAATLDHIAAGPCEGLTWERVEVVA